MIISGTILSGTIAYSTPGVAPTSGQLWTFGYQGQYFNGSAFVQAGALGDGTNTNRSSPVQVLGGTSTWASISFGDDTSHAIKTDGTLWGWGNGQYGELGNNESSSSGNISDFLKSSPVQTVAGGTNWSQISACRYNVGAIKTDGTLWIWGSNSYGQLGNGTSQNKSSPIQTVAAGTNWTYVQAGTTSGGLKSDNTLWMWGNNNDGQIGDGTTVNKSSPVQIGGAVWSSFSTGDMITAAIRTDGTLWSWGNNYFGALGDNTTTKKSSPVQTVSGGSNWSKVSTSLYFTNAIKTDGTLWSWGYNYQGSLGDNTITNRSSPVQIYGGGTTWSKTTAGGSLGVGIKTDGTIWSWGFNNKGQLGLNDISPKSSPTQIGNSTNWIDITVSRFNARTGAILGSGPPTPGTAFVEYLVVGGGGGGGSFGGGGGGGYLTATGFLVTSGTYTVTVGGGGAAGNGTQGTSGNDSVFGSITTKGGGGGGDFNSLPNSVGRDGGSGGGGGSLSGSPYTGAAGGKGVYPGSTYLSQIRQGYDGGAGITNATSSGGGGGAGGAGQNAGAVNVNIGGNGGAGLSSSISGTSTTYAAGGGGSSLDSVTPGAGVTGVSGNGAYNGGGVASTNGTTNRGGGGGGGYVSTGGSGGSGVVFIRYPDSYANAVSTTSVADGYPVISDGYKIYKWITSGSITF